MKPIEMTVDDVKQSAKSGKDQSILKGTATVEGVEVSFNMTVTCDAMDILEVLGVETIHKQVNVDLQPGYQQTL